MSSAVRSRSWSVAVPHDAAGARAARRRLAAELRDHVPAGLLSDAVAVAAELLGNAVQHARPLPGGTIRLAWRLSDAAVGDAAVGDAGGDTGQQVVVRVTDGGSTRRPEPRAVPPDALDGRGLTIVAALATAWGVEPEGTGQTVWAVLVP